ncbi:MAG: pyridoxal-phosphate dependent enzyme [bacterium]|nr:pyridoxal-phosphate dependent enzyme [bacterium]
MSGELVCRGCGTRVAFGIAHFRCPNAGDAVDHVLAPKFMPKFMRGRASFPLDGDTQPFVRFRELLYVHRVAGLSDADFVARVRTLDAAVAQVAGKGFETTPFRGSPELGRALGIDELWVKDETGNVAGSHKARHLFGLLLAEPEVDDRRLAIASCGNAALAAAVLAKAAGRTLDAFVPPHADRRVTDELERLGVTLVRCERRTDDPPGDPCFHRMRAAVRAGAVPFTCQGTENALAIDGGQTLGWELIAQNALAGDVPIGTVAIQVGGGALATAVMQAFAVARRIGAIARMPRFFPVQSAGAAPLERAWRRLALDAARAADGVFADDAPASELARFVHRELGTPAVRACIAAAPRDRARYMWAWEAEPQSVASGILDDETYDWFTVVRATLESGGWPLVVSEAVLQRAHGLARDGTGVDVGATGTAGFAGLLDLAAHEGLDAETRTVALFTGRW